MSISKELLTACDELIRDADARPGAYLHARIDTIRAIVGRAKNPMRSQVTQRKDGTWQVKCWWPKSANLNSITNRGYLTKDEAVTERDRLVAEYS